jgi:hypothetical protein
LLLFIGWFGEENCGPVKPHLIVAEGLPIRIAESMPRET